MEEQVAQMLRAAESQVDESPTQVLALQVTTPICCIEDRNDKDTMNFTPICNYHPVVKIKKTNIAIFSAQTSDCHPSCHVTQDLFYLKIQWCPSASALRFCIASYSVNLNHSLLILRLQMRELVLQYCPSNNLFVFFPNQQKALSSSTWHRFNNDSTLMQTYL